MPLDFMFFFNSILLGVGLAMDAFSVSLANGLHEPNMHKQKMGLVALVFGVFQGAMPLIGWVCIRTVVQYFKAFEVLIPWIALGLLAFIGTKMLLDAIKCGDCEDCRQKLTLPALLLQGIATSIDALSVGFTIAHYDTLPAIAAAALISAVTFLICFAGIAIGKTMGTRLAGKAGIFGGILLIFIGVEIFITSFL